MAKRKPPDPNSFAAGLAEAAAAMEADRKLRKLTRERDEARDKYDAALRHAESLQQRIETLTALGDDRKPPKFRRAKSKAEGEAAAFVLLSDVHAEETVTPDETNGRNEYTLGIAEAALQTVFGKALDLLADSQRMANVRTLVVWLGGDMISGHIHPELAERNSLSPLAACRWVSERLESGLRLLAEQADVDDILIVTSYGNHGRDTPKIRISGGADRSYEHDMYLDLRYRLAGLPRVRWHVSTSYLAYVDVLGSTFRFHHGDAVRYMGGVGGWPVPMNRAVSAWDKERRAAWTFCGHGHSLIEYRPGRWTMNGSVIGYGPYSAWIKADYQDPYQTFAVWDTTRGGTMTRTMPIFAR